jgi:hypothetical protein
MAETAVEVGQEWSSLLRMMGAGSSESGRMRGRLMNGEESGDNWTGVDGRDCLRALRRRGVGVAWSGIRPAVAVPSIL